ncbi:glycosyltransferase family 4 protein [candidate division WOR-3 bacterium]|nr:glycosyltransferase family 4 protein [candidate division WOR-3 bacterium]
MNILIAGNADLPPPYGGMARRISNNVREWEKSHFVSILTFGRKPNPGLKHTKFYSLYPVIHESLRKIDFLKGFIIASQKSVILLFYYSSLYKIIKRTFELVPRDYKYELLHYLGYACKLLKIINKDKIDIIEAQCAFKYSLIAELVGEFSGIPVVISSYAEAIYWEDRKGKDLSKRYDTLYKLVYNKAKKVISASKHCAKGPLKYISKNKVEVVYSSIDTHQFDSYFDKEKEIKKELGYIDNKIVLFVGQLYLRKGPQYLAKASSDIISQFPKVKIIFVGEDFGAKKTIVGAIRRLTDELPLHSNNIIFTGRIDDEYLRKLYVISDVFVFPSITENECMGMSAKEALSAGVSVVAFKIGGIPEAVINGKTGYLVPPRDEKKLAQSIVNCLMQNTKAKMRNECRKRAKELFDIKVSAQKELQILKKVRGL